MRTFLFLLVGYVQLGIGQSVISKENAEHYTWGQGCDGWYLVKRDEMTLIQERMPPGTSETLHKHNKARQFFFVISGSAVIEHGGLISTLTVGDGIEVAAGVPHRVWNKSGVNLDLLVTSLPPSHGDRIEVTSETKLHQR